MSHISAGTELARPFIPAKDFDLSKRFYETLGFEKVLDGEVAIFNAASGGFVVWGASGCADSAFSYFGRAG